MKLVVSKKEYRAIKKLYVTMSKEMKKEFEDFDLLDDIEEDFKIESIKEKALEVKLNHKSTNEFLTVDIDNEFVEDFINVIEIPLIKKIIKLISAIVSLSEKLYNDFVLRLSKVSNKWFPSSNDDMGE